MPRERLVGFKLFFSLTLLQLATSEPSKRVGDPAVNTSCDGNYSIDVISLRYLLDHLQHADPILISSDQFS